MDHAQGKKGGRQDGWHAIFVCHVDNVEEKPFSSVRQFYDFLMGNIPHLEGGWKQVAQIFQRRTFEIRDFVLSAKAHHGRQVGRINSLDIEADEDMVQVTFAT